MALDPQTHSKITAVLEQHPIVLFMKGSRRMPRCGFSATVVGILDGLGVDYKDVDVLADPAVREGIKEFGNWPTIPQLYYKGSLVGGCDIVRELDQSGELAETLGVTLAPVTTPKVTISERAAAVIREAAAQADPGQAVRLTVLQGGRAHELVFDNQRASDIVAEAAGVKFLFDRASAKLADGISIEFVDGPEGGGFQIDNPNAPASVKPLSAAELAVKLKAGEALRLYDVRTDQERAIAVARQLRSGQVQINDGAFNIHAPFGGYEYDSAYVVQGFIDNYQGYYGSVLPWDLGIITLKQPIGNNLGWLGYNHYEGLGDFTANIVGYPGDKPMGTMWRATCNVLAENIGDGYMQYDCDTFPGSSGSAVYAYDENAKARIVVGVNVAESPDANTAVRINAAYLEWINSLNK